MLLKNIGRRNGKSSAEQESTIQDEVILDNSPHSQRLLLNKTNFEILPHVLHRRARFLSAEARAAAIEARAVRISELEIPRKINSDWRIQRPERQHQQSHTGHRRTQNQKRLQQHSPLSTSAISHSHSLSIFLTSISIFLFFFGSYQVQLTQLPVKPDLKCCLKSQSLFVWHNA